MNRLTRLTRLTLRELLEEWEHKEELRLDGADLGDFCDEAGAECRGFVTAQDAWSVLKRIDRAGRCCGVETIAGAEGEALALYVNTGDQYGSTALWCAIRHRVYVTSWADWMELRERYHRNRFPALAA